MAVFILLLTAAKYRARIEKAVLVLHNSSRKGDKRSGRLTLDETHKMLIGQHLDSICMTVVWLASICMTGFEKISH